MKVKSILVIGLVVCIAHGSAVGPALAAPGYVLTIERSAVPVPKEIRELESATKAVAANLGMTVPGTLKDEPPDKLVTHVSSDGFRSEDSKSVLLVSRAGGDIKTYMLNKDSQTYENSLFAIMALGLGVGLLIECHDHSTVTAMPSGSMCCGARAGYANPTGEFKKIGDWKAQKMLLKFSLGDDGGGAAPLGTTTSWYTKDWLDLVEANKMVLEWTARALVSMTDALATAAEDDGETAEEQEEEAKDVPLAPLAVPCAERKWRTSRAEAMVDGVRDFVDTYGVELMNEGPTEVAFPNVKMEMVQRVVSVEKREIPSALFNPPKDFKPSGEAGQKTPAAR